MTERSELEADRPTDPNVERLLARVEELERRLQDRAPAAKPEQRSDRRTFLRLAGVATAGVAAAGLSQNRAAAQSGTFLLGQSNPTTAMTSLTRTTGALTDAALKAAVAGGDSNGVWGDAASSSSAGVYGTSTSGYGVFGSTSQGYDLFAGGNGRIGMYEHLGTGAPTSGNYALGDIFRNASGDLWVCVVAGAAPTTAKFRKVGGPTTAGQLHFITPVRAYASDAVGGGGVISGSNTPRTVSLASAVPANATAALYSLTVFATFNGGFLTVYNADLATAPGVNTIQWYQSNQFITITSTVQVNANREVKANVYAGSQCHFQIDVLGYYL